MITDINSEDRLVQETFAKHLHDVLGWESVYAFNDETFGADGTLGRTSERDVVLVRDLRAAIKRLNPALPEGAVKQAIEKMTEVDFSRSLLQHNREIYGYIRNGVPVEWRDASGVTQYANVQVIDFKNQNGPDGKPNNRFLAVREFKIQGLGVLHYNRRADLVCFVNGIPLVFIELKAVYLNMRAGFDNNLTDYMSGPSINHVFYHNAFLIVSNGHRARYGSITSKWEHFVEWKRNNENEKGRVEAEVLLNGMLAKDRLLDLVENFILFDDSHPGGMRKIVARNHQVLGVNNAVAAVERQEKLKQKYPIEQRLQYRVSLAAEELAEPPITAELSATLDTKPTGKQELMLPLVERADPDLGRLGVVWQTQGSGKSYSMVMFSEKVRRKIPGNFTFVIMTDRDDLDGQIWRTFSGCGTVDPKTTPRASNGRELKKLLTGNHRFIFTLIHKFNQPVSEREPYSLRDDIIVISDEAHRTQAGRFARNMRLALPNASFIGFTGTPLFKYDHLTRRIFGDYISRYDFKRSEEDESTCKLIYENRGEKLGLARLDLNDRIAAKIEEAEMDPDQQAQLEKLLGKDYEVITARNRLNRLALDFVDHCSARWECGKSMLVCIDKITCGRMLKRIERLWKLKMARVRVEISQKAALLSSITDENRRDAAVKELAGLQGQLRWMEQTIIEVIISEAQNEVRDFAKWGINIIPHRLRMKKGFETDDGERMPVSDAFKEPKHPFRIAIVCAMWLTGFDVECLQTLYIDKPMKAHNLMQAIARANRIYPGKDCGLIVDYNGMLKSLREALAQYAIGDGGNVGGPGDPAIPLEDYVPALVEAIEAAEKHLRDNGFNPDRLTGATGFAKTAALADAVDALYTSDETKRRFEIMVREVFSRMKTLILEPSARSYYVRHDNLETIYKKLEERRDTADVTHVLKEIQKIVNEAVRTQGAGEDHTKGLTVDLSKIDFEKLSKEFAKRAKHKHAALQEIRDIVEKKLAQMMAQNPGRMDYYKQYQSIIADYNREKDRTSVEETFGKLMNLIPSIDDESMRHIREGLSEDELALFDLLQKDKISKTDREKLKQASKTLLTALQALLKNMPNWTQNETTRADVRICILDHVYVSLPRPPFTDQDAEQFTDRIYNYVWQRTTSGLPFATAANN
jgi:type I restriction enzyme R subunit